MCPCSVERTVSLGRSEFSTRAIQNANTRLICRLVGWLPDATMMTEGCSKVASLRINRIAPRIALGVFVAASGACQQTRCTPPSEPGYRYIIPSGFTGCIRIEVGVDGGSRLPRWDGYAVIEVKGQDQQFRSSDAIGFASDRLIDEVWVRTDSGLSRVENVGIRSWTEQDLGRKTETVVCFGGAESELETAVQ